MACTELDDHEEVLLQDNRIDGLLLIMGRSLLRYSFIKGPL